MEKRLHIGLGLQTIFILLFFTGLLPGKIYGALFATLISLYSLSIGIRSYRSKQKRRLSSVVILLGLILSLFTIYAYYIGEGGIPPEILQF